GNVSSSMRRTACRCATTLAQSPKRASNTAAEASNASTAAGRLASGRARAGPCDSGIPAHSVAVLGAARRELGPAAVERGEVLARVQRVQLLVQQVPDAAVERGGVRAVEHHVEVARVLPVPFGADLLAHHVVEARAGQR